MSFQKSEMQRIREVMAKDGYEVVRMEYGYWADPSIHDESGQHHDGWEELRVTLIDRRADGEPFQTYYQPWLLSYNLAMWEACGFRSDDLGEYLARVKAWQDDGHPVPSRDEAHALYQLEVVA